METTILIANRAKKDLKVKGTFEKVISEFSKKPGIKITDCRLDHSFKNKTIWYRGVNMYTIVYPSNE
jgi:hypothetical protein